MERLAKWSTTIPDSAVQSRQVRSLGHLMRPSRSSSKQAANKRQSMDRSVSVYSGASPAQSLAVLTDSKWQPLQPSSSAIDLNQSARADWHHIDSSVALHDSTTEAFPDYTRRSLDTSRASYTRTAVASKRMSRVQGVPSTVCSSSPKKGSRAEGLVQQGAVRHLVNKSKSLGSTMDSLVVTDLEGRAQFIRVIDLLCPPPVGYTPDAFEERVDLIKELVDTALAKKGMKLSAESIFQTLEGKMNRRLKTFLDAGLVTEPEIQSTRISLAFALARHLCGASPLTSYLRLYAGVGEQTDTAVFYPGIGPIISVCDIVSGVKTESPTDSVHLLYPSVPSVQPTPLSLERNRILYDPRRSVELSRELARGALTTIGRPPPPRPIRTGKRPGTAISSKGERSADTTIFKPLERLSRPMKQKSSRSRPNTSDSSGPPPPADRAPGVEDSILGSSSASGGHTPRREASGGLSEGDESTPGSGAASRTFVTADTSIMKTTELSRDAWVCQRK
ncbi:hypothetical protein BCV69DRAFT_280407 [Microstroma glucosiphilum]|uniref:Uncharacterized protein n=1 Tax=Pseudomicrostroma glucosiphilum TaxID=1684307 RepID=A0A316UD38_9BASI|nr:hypothetical protein BCV69DRAFT_280407 [Pseudomicrostroma glucosiphilum]PWN22798.1 hypothetical protein BCV69DRAFT_280407 [Pseudomicrostroma glucosiphilum]